MSGREERELFVRNDHGTSFAEIAMITNLFWVSFGLLAVVNRLTTWRDAATLRSWAHWAVLFLPLLFGVTWMATDLSTGPFVPFLTKTALSGGSQSDQQRTESVDGNNITTVPDLTCAHFGATAWFALLIGLAGAMVRVDSEIFSLKHSLGRNQQLIVVVLSLGICAVLLLTRQLWWPPALLLTLSLLCYCSLMVPRFTRMVELERRRLGLSTQGKQLSNEIAVISLSCIGVPLFGWAFGLVDRLLSVAFLFAASLGPLHALTSSSFPHEIFKENRRTFAKEGVDQVNLLRDARGRFHSMSFYRAGTAVTMAVCILAVDFAVFPRRLAKTHAYGLSLMDLGVGSVIFSSSLFHAVPAPGASRARGDQQVRQSSQSLKSALILATLGLLRTVAVAAVNYQSPVDEYGRHWNFFITLACVVWLQGLLDWSAVLHRLVYPRSAWDNAAVVEWLRDGCHRPSNYEVNAVFRDEIVSVFEQIVSKYSNYWSFNFCEENVVRSIEDDINGCLPLRYFVTRVRRGYYDYGTEFAVVPFIEEFSIPKSTPGWRLRFQIDTLGMRTANNTKFVSQKNPVTTCPGYSERVNEIEDSDLYLTPPLDHQLRQVHPKALGLGLAAVFRAVQWSLGVLSTAWRTACHHCVWCAGGHCGTPALERRFIPIDNWDVRVFQLCDVSNVPRSNPVVTLVVDVIPWTDVLRIVRAFYLHVLRPRFKFVALFVWFLGHQALLSHQWTVRFLQWAASWLGGSSSGAVSSASVARSVLSWSDETRTLVETNAGWMGYWVVANAEGLLSVPGYIAIWAAVQLFRFKLNPDFGNAKYPYHPSRFVNGPQVSRLYHQRFEQLVVNLQIALLRYGPTMLCLILAALWGYVLPWTGLPSVLGFDDAGWAVSRRLANPSYVFAVLALNTFVVDSLFVVSSWLCCLSNTAFYSPLVDAISSYQLEFFLLANVLTGLVNSIFDTIHMSALAAMAILITYTVVLSIAILQVAKWRRRRRRPKE